MIGILLSPEGDLMVSSGTLALGQAEGQAIELLLGASCGEFKEMPLLGGEALRLLGGEPDPMWCALFKKQLKSVGIEVARVEMTTDGINIIK